MSTKIDVLALLSALEQYAVLRGGSGCEAESAIAKARAAVAELIAAAAQVLEYRQGGLPTQGWLRDNDRSRAALASLQCALANIGEAP